MFRLKVLPISLALPWGLNVGDMLGHVPLPAKITIDVLEPIDLRAEFGEEPDLDEVYAEVLGRMQAALTALQAERQPAGARLMRVERTRTIDAPRERIWERVRDPASYPHFVEGITRCEPKGRADPVDGGAAPTGDEPGLGSRYSHAHARGLRRRGRPGGGGGVRRARRPQLDQRDGHRPARALAAARDLGRAHAGDAAALLRGARAAYWA